MGAEVKKGLEEPTSCGPTLVPVAHLRQQGVERAEDSEVTSKESFSSRVGAVRDKGQGGRSD